ncbi:MULTISPECIES: CGNR zinc finger domain-containing protein [unclassified Nonomuraea]|uniref:CGNR zinc finger domain-containing protein n=1 Tax=unclassified Nonomuraea TaxID=2593643 RepID=UPI00207BC5A1|nr:CGNR zinc finger domain-containing protein [Nonomuraea sp. KC401]
MEVHPTVHSTKAMAARAVDLCVALLHEQPSIASVSRILRDHGEIGELDLSENDLTAMRDAATRLREVLGAPSTGEAAALLNRLLAGGAQTPRLTSHAGATTWHLHVDSGDDAPWGEWFLASSAMALAVLLADHQRVPGGLCAARGCGRPFLDLGGGSPRRYCSARCATRERVAAHRSRSGSGAAPRVPG